MCVRVISLSWVSNCFASSGMFALLDGFISYFRFGWGRIQGFVSGGFDHFLLYSFRSTSRSDFLSKSL